MSLDSDQQDAESFTVLLSRPANQGGDGQLAEESKTPCLMVMAGPYLGRIFELREQRLLLGRSDEADVSIHDLGLSRRHAELQLLADGSVMIRDLGSRNGTFVNGHRIVDPRVLTTVDQVKLGRSTVLKFSYRRRLAAGPWDEDESMGLDQTTGVHHRAYFHDRLERSLRDSHRAGVATSLVSLEIDLYGSLYDEEGPEQARLVLSRLGQLLLLVTRHTDLVARHGESDFAILARETTYSEALLLAERARRAVELNLFRDAMQREPLTISVGVVTLVPTLHQHVDDFLAAADAQVGRARREGRNRVCGSPPLVETRSATA